VRTNRHAEGTGGEDDGSGGQDVRIDAEAGALRPLRDEKRTGAMQKWTLAARHRTYAAVSGALPEKRVRRAEGNLGGGGGAAGDGARGELPPGTAGCDHRSFGRAAGPSSRNTAFGRFTNFSAATLDRVAAGRAQTSSPGRGFDPRPGHNDSGRRTSRFQSSHPSNYPSAESADLDGTGSTAGITDSNRQVRSPPRPD